MHQEKIKIRIYLHVHVSDKGLPKYTYYHESYYTILHQNLNFSYTYINKS